MQHRIFHGNISVDDIARALIGQYNRGNLRAQQLGEGKKAVVQIASRSQPASGGQTALSISLQQVEDGVAVNFGKQNWLGVAASIGQTAFHVWRNPWAIIDRLDDLAQDIEYIQLSEQVSSFLENTARMAGATFELSERYRRMECPYCGVANPVGEARCIACGAPLGKVQPVTCPKCGYLLEAGESACPNCGSRLASRGKS